MSDISIYESDVDVENDNSAHAFALRMVGHNKRVLELGCAGGHVTKVLAERGNSVTACEYDEAVVEPARKHAERVIVGDLEHESVWQEIAWQNYDVAMAGDVLEHLRDPLPVLRKMVKVLAPGGFVVISLPNVAHGDVRMALLQGKFRYSATGILDSTHLRFFTEESISELLANADLSIVGIERVTAPLFSTELPVDRDLVCDDVVAQLIDDPNATTYQFVIKAVRNDADHAIEEALAQMVSIEREFVQQKNRNYQQEIHLNELGQMLEELSRKNEADVERIEQLANALEASRREVRSTHAEVEAYKRSRAVRYSRRLRRILPPRG